MPLYTLQTSDTLPFIKSPAGVRIAECDDVSLLATIGTTSQADVIKRLANDHVAFVAYINNTPAAFGWMARGKAYIGELDHQLILPVGNRYLWNFRTMEAFRGLGIYPALLHYIIRRETEKANRFWIIHAPENTSSLKGIKKAGFQYVGKLYSSKGKAAIETTNIPDSSFNLLSQMNISISTEQAASCWNCSSPHLKKRKLECCCTSKGDECIGNNLLSLASAC